MVSAPSGVGERADPPLRGAGTILLTAPARTPTVESCSDRSYRTCLLTSLVISNMFTLDRPLNTGRSFASAMIMRRFLGSCRRFRLMYFHSFWVSTVRGIGVLPITAAKAASGRTGFMKAGFGFRFFLLFAFFLLVVFLLAVFRLAAFFFFLRLAGFLLAARRFALRRAGFFFLRRTTFFFRRTAFFFRRAGFFLRRAAFFFLRFLAMGTSEKVVNVDNQPLHAPQSKCFFLWDKLFLQRRLRTRLFRSVHWGPIGGSWVLNYPWILRRNTMRLWYRMIFVGTVTAVAGGCLGELTEVEIPNVENLALRSVSVGGFHACSVADDGNVYCWGLNSVGQLGDQTFNGKTGPVRVVAGNLTFTAVTAGGAHTCALTPTGDAYCWGFNTSGQVGDGLTIGSRVSPVPVSGGFTFDLVSPGAAHTCGVTVGGDAYCWGQNSSGQLGIGTAGPDVRATPRLVQGNLIFTSISAGADHTCGIAEGGAAYCWGEGGAGRLGNGTTDSQAAPTAVVGNLLFTQVSAGGTHSCGVTANGEDYCWGDGASGQLGNGATSNSSAPVMVPVPAGELPDFLVVSSGGSHTCAVLVKAAQCWGLNDAGQLGDGTTTNRVAPIDVTGGLNFRAVSAGFPAFAASACGITSGDIVYCWGSGASGQLGNGATDDQSTPVRVFGQR